MVFYLYNSSNFITFPSNGGLEASSETCFTKFDHGLGHYDCARGSCRIRASYGGEAVPLSMASEMSCNVPDLGLEVWRFEGG